MTIMPFEGVQYPTLEDEYGIALVSEPTHTEADEAWYCSYVLSGEADEAEQDYADWAEDTYDPDDWKVGQDRWERSFWGD